MPLPVATVTADPTSSTRTGNVLELFPSDRNFDIVIRRAPDSAGAPNLGAITTLAAVPGTTQFYTDILPADGATYWYGVGHIRNGYTTVWSEWKSSVAAVLPDRVPDSPTTLGAVAGMIMNTAISPTRVVRLDAATAIPTSAVSWIDLAAAAGNFILRFGASIAVPVLTLDTLGNLVIAGTLKPTALTMLTGVATFAGTLLNKSIAVFTETTGTATTGKRIELTGGTFSLFKDIGGTETSEVVRIGDFDVVAGTLIAKQDTSWTVTTGNKTTTSSAGGGSGDAGPTNPINTGADLPGVGNKYYLDFQLQIQESWSGALSTVLVSGYAQAMLWVSTDGGTNWSSYGAIATLYHDDTRNGTTSQTYTAAIATVTTISTTNNQTVFKITPYTVASIVQDSGGSPITVTAVGTANVTDGTSKVAWSKANGTTVNRRGPWFRCKTSQPAFSVEPHLAAVNTLPTAANTAEGEVFYNGDAHRWTWKDDNGFGHILRAVEAALAADGAQSTALADVKSPTELQFPVTTGEKWRVELEGWATGMATNGIIINMTLPTTSSRTFEQFANSTGTAAVASNRNTAGTDTACVTYAGDGYVKQVQTFVATATGTAQVTYKSGATGNTKLLMGFCMRAVRIG